MPFTTIPGSEPLPAVRIASNAARRNGETLISDLITWINKAIREFWHNDETPEDIYSDLGADAPKTFTGHQSAVQLLFILWALDGREGQPQIDWPPYAFQVVNGILVVDRNTPFTPPQ